MRDESGSGDRRFPGSPEHLRRDERTRLLQVERVVDLALEGVDASSVLDVGTGSGLFAEVFYGRGLTVAGVDVRPEMVAAAQTAVPEGHFRQGVAEALPYPDGAFDLVFMGLVLHEADDRMAALGEARRVARLRLAILEWPPEPGTHGPPLAHRLTVEAVRELAAAAGLQGLAVVRLDQTVLYRADLRE
jgi:ubiquinone/menaquinone biosynthesis C-methylase UbiE